MDWAPYPGFCWRERASLRKLDFTLGGAIFLS